METKRKHCKYKTEIEMLTVGKRNKPMNLVAFLY